jgi:hypothetical protein
MPPPMVCKFPLKSSFWIKFLDKLALMAPPNNEKNQFPTTSLSTGTPSLVLHIALFAYACGRHCWRQSNPSHLTLLFISYSYLVLPQHRQFGTTLSLFGKWMEGD